MKPPRWNIITPSQYEHERRALDFVREGLPDHDPYRAWTNFEFLTPEGAIYEVDLLVLTKQGFWLVEIKSRPGQLRGDAGTWTWYHEGRTLVDDNPIFLANRKAKALVGMLKRQAACRRIRVPWLDELIFLSADDLQCNLDPSARSRVCLTDRPKDDPRGERKGILAALINRDVQGVEPTPRSPIDSRVAQAITRALEQAGIRPSQRARRVGDYVLADLLSDGTGFQDRLAKHASFDDVFCRVRIYTLAQAASEDQRERLRRAAHREFRILRTLEHPHILPLADMREHELGPALLYKYDDPEAVRLDHFVATHNHKLTPDLRLDLLRQLADAIRYAHGKRVIHRGLGPQSVLVFQADSKAPQLRVFNWQVGVRETTSTSGRTSHVEDLVESQGLVYMAPESIVDPRKVSEASDVFSLGAIAYLLFAGRPPAPNLAEMNRLLRESKGYRISSVLDGAGERLEELIHWSTQPEVLSRVGSVDDFLALLVDVEDELTAPDEKHVTDPLEAKRGDRLEGGFVVERELGEGTTAKALLVTKEDWECVLKIARTEQDNTRLHDEGATLRKIRSEFIVGLEAEMEMAGRRVLVLQKAGDQTLAARLTKEGPCGMELLARFGDDLLSAVASLERHGVHHRDIKPDNIGIRSISKQRLQLCLFDFSLSKAPLDNVHVGTPGYLDPFLSCREPARWDPAAERYSAAVTLYQMATGTLPRWGDDQSDPALVEEPELDLQPELFDANVRDGLIEFFETALNRHVDHRFQNAEQMRRAWGDVFEEAERQTVTTPSGEEVALGVSLDDATSETLVAAMGLSTRCRNVLERENVVTVRELLRFPLGEIRFMRGVGNKTRLELLTVISKLRERFPDLIAGAKPTPSRPEEEDLSKLDLDAVYQRVIGIRTSRTEGQWKVRAGLLATEPDTSESVTAWPSQADVAVQIGITRARVGQVLAADRKRWSKDPAVTVLRQEICAGVLEAGGVMTVPELMDLVLSLRSAGEDLGGDQRQRMASAVARACLETEAALADPRMVIRRSSGKVVAACSPELAAYAERLGSVADRLADEDPLPSPIRTFQQLYTVDQPEFPAECRPPGNERLLALAAAMSAHAALSSRQELYPRGMPAIRAIRLGIGALTGLGLGNGTRAGFTPGEVRRRIESRYPEAEPLPDHPELEALLNEAGLDVTWDADNKVYRRRVITLVTAGSSYPERFRTVGTSRRPEVTEDVAEARRFDERLRHAREDGSFLVLTTPFSRMRPCEDQILREFDVERISLDGLLLDRMRAAADELGADWQVVQTADGADPTSRDWQNLVSLVDQVMPGIEEMLLSREKPVLLVHPGLLARYEQLELLEHLRDDVGRNGRTPGLWVLVASDAQSDMPMLDGKAIPLITPGQRARVPEPWIENLHRGGVEVAASPET